METIQWGYFGYGLLGSLAPEVLRLYNLRLTIKKEDFNLFYILISIVYGCLAGFLTILFSANSILGAFYIGISTPVLISSIENKFGKSNSENFNETSMNVGSSISSSKALSKLTLVRMLFRRHSQGLF